MSNYLLGSSRPLAERYQLALLDLDGVVYRGKEPVDYAAESIRKAERSGMMIEYTTNNSSRFQHVVASQLQSFGLQVEPWQVITSSVVAARMVAKALPAGSKVLVLGAEHLRQEVERAGLTVCDNLSENPVAVIQGWYPDMTWRMLENVSHAVESGAQYFVTNQDLTIPREFGSAPGCGSMVQAVINATGVEPVASAGKPEPYMYDEARQLNARVGRDGSDGRSAVPKELSLAVGDRLDTDIEAGNRGGYDSLAVLTGVTNPRELMLAPAYLRPTYVAQDLRGLNEPMPAPVDCGSGHWTCADGEATFDKSSNAIQVNDETSMNALRAAICLAWQLADSGIDMTAVALGGYAGVII